MRSISYIRASNASVSTLPFKLTDHPLPHEGVKDHRKNRGMPAFSALAFTYAIASSSEALQP